MSIRQTLKIPLLALSLFLVIGFPGESVYAIQKCQDEEGRWHYGDIAECENAKITTLTKRGFIKEEQEAPKTKEERIAEQKARELAEAEEKRKRLVEEDRRRILSVYETEADIDRQRDNQLNAVEGNIAVHESYLKSMADRVDAHKIKLEETTQPKVKKQITEEITKANKRIKVYQAQLEKLLVQREQIIQRFAREKEIYQSIKGRSETAEEI